MPYFDSDGNEVQAFSQEELDLLEKEKNEAIDKAQADLKAKEEELEKLKEKDLNFSNLRAKKENAEKQIETLKGEIDEKLQTVKKEVLEGVLKDHYSDTLKNLASDDEELKKKIEFHYARLNDPAVSKVEVDKKLRDAWALATHTEEPTALNSAAISSGYTGINHAQANKTFTQDEKNFAKRLAAAGGMVLDDKDFS